MSASFHRQAWVLTSRPLRRRLLPMRDAENSYGSSQERTPSAQATDPSSEEDLRSTELAVARAAASGAGVHDLAPLILARLCENLHPSEQRFSLLVDDNLSVVASRHCSGSAPNETRVMLSTTPAALSRLRGAAVQVRVGDMAGEFASIATFEPDTYVLVVPVHVEEAAFGFFELVRRHTFAPPEVELVTGLAGMLGTALVRERRLEQLARHAEHLQQRMARGEEELTRTQEQLVQAAKLSTIGEIAAGLVHEINQPLNVLGGYVELLREGRISDNQRGRALDVMNRAVERMTGLVDNLRTFARSGSAVMQPLEVATVIQMARELTAGAHRRGVPVACEPGLYVRGDTARLEQVLINLIANALQSEGDPVSLHAYALDGNRVAIEVRDRGPGVPVEIRHRIFEPFFTTRPPGQGTGLGLSISARILQEHEGRLEVDDNPGGGAIFRIVLPRCAAPADT